MYRFMDKEEIEINQIDNLKMIHMYDLSGAENVPALAVYYGDNKQINLCVMDKNYNLLVERILFIYSKCRDRNSIIMDEHTRKLIELACSSAEQGMESGAASGSRLGRKYMSMAAEQVTRFHTAGYIRIVMMPLVKYYLRELYSLWDMDIEFEDSISGWHGSGILRGRSSGQALIFPVRISFSETGRYQINVGNFLEESNIIVFDIKYSQESLVVYFDSEDYKLTGESRFEFNAYDAVCSTMVRANNTPVYCNEERLKKVEPDIMLSRFKVTMLDMDVRRANIYALPWDAFYLYSADCMEGEGCRRTDYDTAYANYNTREKIEESVQQRFTPIYVDYDNYVEEQILADYKDWYQFVVAFRKATDAWGDMNDCAAAGILTTRDACRIKKYLDNGSFDAARILDYEFIQTKDMEYLAFLVNHIKQHMEAYPGAAEIFKMFEEKVNVLRQKGGVR